MKKTLYINIFGSPGSGKSTLATELFSTMKKSMPEYVIEYVPEFAKQFCFDDQINSLFQVPENQMYIGSNQYYNIYKLDGKVDVVITDSPYMMSCIYNNSILLGKNYDIMVKNIFCSHSNLNIFLKLNKEKYQQSGRNETASQSEILQDRLLKLLSDYQIDFVETKDCKKIIELTKEQFSSIKRKPFEKRF